MSSTLLPPLTWQEASATAAIHIHHAHTDTRARARTHTRIRMDDAYAYALLQEAAATADGAAELGLVGGEGPGSIVHVSGVPREAPAHGRPIRFEIRSRTLYPAPYTLHPAPVRPAHPI